MTSIRFGKLLLLLDGLDEVPTVAQRIFVRDAVDLFQKRFRRNRFIVTVRVLSYQPPTEVDAEHGIADLRLDPAETAEKTLFESIHV